MMGKLFKTIESRNLNFQSVGSKEKYKNLCALNSSIPLFSKDWWLDTVCGDNWDVLICELDGKIVASWPIFQKKILFFSAITQPPMAPNLGIWIDWHE
ncbi:hypothetical protein [Solitalea koreensis]|nr:hypothetical protein [Solitalea koreensis]